MNHKTLATLLLLGWLGAAAGGAQAQAPAAAPPAADQVAAPAATEGAPAATTPVKRMTLWQLIVVGGWAMWPLGACSFGLIMMAALNFRLISEKKLMPPAVLAQLKTAAQQRDLQTLWDLSSATDSLFTNALSPGLRRVDPDNPAGSKEQIESAIADAVAREESQAGYWLNFLSLITAISPMLGLLGTVSGMIGAFQKIAGGGMGKPELLAGNIGEALITTAAGLIIAIPSMFFYFLFRNKLNQILQKAEEEYSLIVDDLTGTGLARLAEGETEESKPA